MTLQPIPNFTHVTTHHCVTGSLRHIYLFNQHDISEEMLLGVGEGVGFVYWHQKGNPPVFGGRAQPKPSFEEIAGQRTGVTITPHVTRSARKAESTLLEMLEAGQPVMLQVDMGFLPYFDFGGEEYHFGGHVVVACGYDPATGTVLIADRDEELHPVSLEDLANARGSTYKPFPPRNAWFTFDFSDKRPPTVEEIYQAISAQAAGMLNPPIRNLGVKGIQKAAEVVPDWPAIMDEQALRFALFNTYIFISPVGGSGGGTFRYMFGRFLREAADLTSEPALLTCADTFQAIGDAWARVGDWCKDLSEAPHPADSIGDITPMLNEVAEMEQAGWSELQAVVAAAKRVADGRFEKAR
jgi:hypothetical protein